MSMELPSQTLSPNAPIYWRRVSPWSRSRSRNAEPFAYLRWTSVSGPINGGPDVSLSWGLPVCQWPVALGDCRPFLSLLLVFTSGHTVESSLNGWIDGRWSHAWSFYSTRSRSQSSRSAKTGLSTRRFIVKA
jgi:hypothetical protein